MMIGFLRSVPARPLAREAARSAATTADKPIDGQNADAVVFGGFGFGPRQMAKHEALYSEHGFGIEPVVSTVKQMTTPAVANARGKVSGWILTRMCKSSGNPTTRSSLRSCKRRIVTSSCTPSLVHFGP